MMPMPSSLRVARAGMSTAAPSTRDLARVLGHGAAQDLHQRRLARRRSRRAGRAPRPRALPGRHVVEREHAGNDFADPLGMMQPAAAAGQGSRTLAAAEPRSSRTTRLRARTTRRGSTRSLVDALERRAQRQLAHLDPRLVDRGERRWRRAASARVVVADERDVVGHAQAALLDRVEGADARRGRWAAKIAVGRAAWPSRRQRAVWPPCLRVGP